MADYTGYRLWHEKKYRMSLILIEIVDGEICIRNNVNFININKMISS